MEITKTRELQGEHQAKRSSSSSTSTYWYKGYPTLLTSLPAIPKQFSLLYIQYWRNLKSYQLFPLYASSMQFKTTPNMKSASSLLQFTSHFLPLSPSPRRKKCRLLTLKVVANNVVSLLEVWWPCSTCALKATFLAEKHRFQSPHLSGYFSIDASFSVRSRSHGSQWESFSKHQ